VAIIHINCAVDIYLGTIRPGRGGENTRTYPNAVVDSDKMVKLGEIFYTFRKPRGGKPSSKGAFSCKGRTSLNGFNLTGYNTKSDLYADLRIIGIASSTEASGDSLGEVVSGSGVSVTVGGTFTIRNISTTTFFPGDLAIAKAPSFKAAKRREELDAMPNQGNERSRDKLTFVASRFDPEKAVRRPFRYACRFLFDPAYVKSNPIDIQKVRDKFNGGHGYILSKAGQLAYRLKELELTKILQAVGYLHRAGYITITHAAGLRNATDYKSDVDAAAARNRNAADLVNTQNSMMHMATTFGLASDEQFAPQDMQLQKMLVLQTVGSAVGDMPISETETARDAIIENFKLNFGVTDDQMEVYPPFYNSFKESVAGQYWYDSLHSLDNLNSLYGSLLADTLERIVCKVNNYSDPGDPMHCVV
jgi:hypothetical protein